jgi:CRISPR/Cas system CSM-associated protein Csm3 (group 7 of RAMP superfamily)
METKKAYTHRFLARVVLEAETPLFIGSGETSLTTDAIVQRDIHGFPMIPGTSLTGVLRHALEDDENDITKWNSFFGYQAPRGKKGLGSQIKISSAYMILESGKVAEGLTPNFDTKNYVKFFQNLPVRQHVRITHKGVADVDNNGLFDNEVVYRGGKFLFEIELKGTEEDKPLWDEFINELKSPLFRVGQGTRKGYGHMEVSDLKSKVFDIREQADFEAYLSYNPSLNASNSILKSDNDSHKGDKGFIRYKLELKPESFFIFSAGYGDEEVDNIPVTESILEYKNSKLDLSEEKGLIPASSIKGALRHRTAFHYNKLLKKYADNITDDKYLELLKANNDAVYELFGAEVGVADRGNKENENYKSIVAGELLIK